ncbi:hypothetical protein SCHPADRAFT_352535 [Schizopora paradoxa]|uniref:Uncharacterized protein n=1 Tax=Schizopora paradoxa TaxID=27342 RepID=A0A0H2RNU8_9AGAM|nr:hypothetical protein SCHPADRAFT_352535 [Schizopora paradoxa]
MRISATVLFIGVLTSCAMAAPLDHSLDESRHLGRTHFAADIDIVGEREAPEYPDRRAVIDIPPIPDFGGVSFKSDTLNSAFKRNVFEGVATGEESLVFHRKSKGAEMDSLASGF